MSSFLDRFQICCFFITKYHIKALIPVNIWEGERGLKGVKKREGWDLARLYLGSIPVFWRGRIWGAGGLLCWGGGRGRRVRRLLAEY